jgi:hypothetical protein
VGDVDSVLVSKSSGYSDFDSAAVNGARRCVHARSAWRSSGRHVDEDARALRAGLDRHARLSHRFGGQPMSDLGRHAGAAPRNARPFANVLETIGWTPLIRLNRVVDGARTPVYAKAEFFNPGGSVKDRIGLAMIEAPSVPAG